MFQSRRPNRIAGQQYNNSAHDASLDVAYMVVYKYLPVLYV